MTIKEKLQQDLKESLKKKDTIRLNTVRSIINAIKNKEIDLRKELTEDEIYGILNTLAKQRRESIEQYEKGGRQDLVEQEKRELEIILEYLPEQLSDEEIEKIVKETIEEVGASSIKDMGKVMKAVMPKVKGRADGKKVNEMVKKFLSWKILILTIEF